MYRGIVVSPTGGGGAADPNVQPAGPVSPNPSPPPPPPQPVPVPEVEWYKKPKVVIPSLVVLLVVIGAAVYFVRKGRKGGSGRMPTTHY